MDEAPKEILPPKVPKYVHDVVDFYEKVSTQWVVGFGGLVGLNYQSVKDMAEVFDFELTAFNMSMIQEIEYFTLKRSNNKDG